MSDFKIIQQRVFLTYNLTMQISYYPVATWYLSRHEYRVRKNTSVIISQAKVDPPSTV